MTLAPPAERFDTRAEASRVTPADAERAAKDLGLAGVRAIRPLSGGFSNANFRIDAAAGTFVLRFYWNGKATGEREAAVLKVAAERGIRVPKIHDFRSDERRTVALIECAEGETFETRLLKRHDGHEAVFRAVGRQLALTHQVRFPSAGLLDAQGRIFHAFENFPDECLSHLLAPLKPGGRGRARLGEEGADRLAEFARSRWEGVRRAYTGPCLTHCDFNPKNLMISPAGEPMLIDWEFAMAADAMIDLGNFFRFEADDYAPGSRAAFAEGYEEAGGRLPDDWEAVARLVDLAAMAGFLGTDADYQKTFHTARVVVARSLATA